MDPQSTRKGRYAQKKLSEDLGSNYFRRLMPRGIKKLLS